MKLPDLPAKPTDEMSHDMWTDLYAPRSIGDLVGNKGAIDQLFEWLRDWDDVQIKGNKK